MKSATCSRRTPRPTTRAGMRCRIGYCCMSRRANGGFGCSRKLQRRADDVVLRRDLYRLRDARREAAAALHRLEIRDVERLRQQRLGEDVRRGDGVLHGEVDADAADRRHGVRRVADAEKPGLYHWRSRSTRTVSSLTSSQDAIAFMRSRANGEAAATASRKASRPPRLELLERALRNDVGALPVVAAVEQREDGAGAEAAHGLAGVTRRGTAA